MAALDRRQTTERNYWSICYPSLLEANGPLAIPSEHDRG